MSVQASNANLIDLTATASIAIASQATVYSNHFALPAGNPSFAIEYKGTGTVRLQIELEQGNQAPATENAADNAWVVPDGAAEINDTLQDELYHIKAYSPAATRFGRFKITGNSGNGADTVLERLKVSWIA